MADAVHRVEATGESALRLATLLYHDVVPPGEPDSTGFPGGAAGVYKLEWPDFESHLERLQRVGSGVPAPPEAIVDATATGWALTFDDGGRSAAEIGERLARRGMQATFLITVDRIGTPGFVGRDDIRDLRASGHSVGSHSCSHPERMSRCTWEELEYEWGRSVEVLSEILDERVVMASVPAGYYSRTVARAAANVGLRALFTSEPVMRTQRVDGCLVLGRFTILRQTPADVAAALAWGNRVERAKQLTNWNAKKVLKTLGGPAYVAARRKILAGR